MDDDFFPLEKDVDVRKIAVIGHVVIRDRDTKEVLVNQRSRCISDGDLKKKNDDAS